MTTHQPWIRARVSVHGHRSLGVVNIRYLDGGGIEIDDGRRYGSGAWFSIEPLPPEIKPTESEIHDLQTAFGKDTQIERDTKGRWAVLLPDGSVWESVSILHSLASAVQGIRFTDRIKYLREGAASVSPADPRAALVLDALMKLEPSRDNATIRRSPSYGPTMPGKWSLSVNYQRDSVEGSLDDVARYILDMGEPVKPPAEVEPVADSLPTAPKSIAEASADEIPF